MTRWSAYACLPLVWGILATAAVVTHRGGPSPTGVTRRGGPSSTWMTHHGGGPSPTGVTHHSGPSSTWMTGGGPSTGILERIDHCDTRCSKVNVTCTLGTEPFASIFTPTSLCSVNTIATTAATIALHPGLNVCIYENTHTHLLLRLLLHFDTLVATVRSHS